MFAELTFGWKPAPDWQPTIADEVPDLTDDRSRGPRRRHRLEQAGTRVRFLAGQADLVFDTIGGEVLARSPALLRPGGTLVVIKADARRPAGRGDITTVVFIQESSRDQLTELARLVDEGQLRPQVGLVYPLAEAAQGYRAKAAQGYRAKAAGGISGRVILRP